MLRRFIVEDYFTGNAIFQRRGIAMLLEVDASYFIYEYIMVELGRETSYLGLSFWCYLSLRVSTNMVPALRMTCKDIEWLLRRRFTYISS